MAKELPKAYEPQAYEDGVYQKWEDGGYFNPDNLDLAPAAPSYTISLPPPNVTGVLHAGHAAMLALEDILVRYHRMKGERSLWVPGTDHAAIATQTKVEKIIKNEGTNRHKLGREEFLKRVEKYAQECHDGIVNQVKKMGSSCDWSREAFTLDDTRTKAVRAVFKMMYDDGLIYRGERIVNWCTRCQSTLADDEVDYEEQKGKLYTFKYSADFPFAIATTRPETKLGDTAVAVNPDDSRYRDYVGKIFEIDFVGLPLEIKIIADRRVEAEFGTGALGVTPAHSAVDAQMAVENDLKTIKVIDETGKIRSGFGDYTGLKAVEAREKIVARLREKGLLEKEETISNNISLCYRCNTPIEPLPSEQWFIDVNKKIRKQTAESRRPKADGRKRTISWEGKSIKEVALEVVKSGKIRIIPERFEKSYYHWMENLRDWCISRQIWYGHRIPVWYANRGKIDLILVRHGQTDWNKNGIMQGQKDIPLNGNGKKSAAKLAKKIEEEKFDLIITSPLKRTSETAKLLNAYNVPMIEDDRLKERHYGKFEGLKTDEILKIHPEIKTLDVNGLQYWIEVPTAETYEDVKKRVIDFLADIKKKYHGKKVLVVSHGDTLDMFYAVLNNLPNEKVYGRFSYNMHIEHFPLKTDEVHVGIEAPKENGWEQDSDTLDTWFSSGLWTFSTLAHNPGDIWLEDGQLIIDTEDFRKFHPTAVLETGYDILFFWVARMIIMTTYAVGDIPFHDVYLHGLVKDDKGRKMSKSLGNIIDPLDMIKKFGADATRLSLVIGTTPGNDINLSEAKIAGYRNFVNKIWNIARYIIMQNAIISAKGGSPPGADQPLAGAEILGGKDSTCLPAGGNDKVKCKIFSKDLTLSDRWILGKMEGLVREVTNDLDNYRFSMAGERLKEFSYNDLADWYIEASKFEKGGEKDKIFGLIIRDLLKLWHPFMPFVTEALWPEFGGPGMLITAPWPDSKNYAGFKDEIASAGFAVVQSVISAIRNLRAENKLKPVDKVKAIIYAGENTALLKSQSELIKSLRTGISELEIKEKGEKIAGAWEVKVGEMEIYLKPLLS
jgi:valyl-tRNA synthetase